MKKAGLSFEQMFEEVPVIIKNSQLCNALCCELDEIAPPENPYNFLDLATRSVLSPTIQLFNILSNVFGSPLLESQVEFLLCVWSQTCQKYDLLMIKSGK